MIAGVSKLINHPIIGWRSIQIKEISLKQEFIIVLQSVLPEYQVECS